MKRDHIIRPVEAELGSPASLKVLDLGCGIGAYHAGLESRFGELHGVDVSAKSVEMAMRSHPNGHYKVSSGDTLLIWRILGRRASQSGPSGRM
ncbi:MAG: methyltransferase domain-containing protein [Luteimonas sp.]